MVRPVYSDCCGDETAVVRMHSGNGPHEEMDRRAIECFDEAMSDVGLAADDPSPVGAPRLLRVGDDDHHGPISRLGR